MFIDIVHLASSLMVDILIIFLLIFVVVPDTLRDSCNLPEKVCWAPSLFVVVHKSEIIKKISENIKYIN